MVVSEIMTRGPVVTQSSTTVHEVIDILMSLDARHLPIVDGDELVGMVSAHELRPFMRAAVAASERDAAAKALRQPIASVMNSDFASVEAKADLGRVVQAMVDLRLEALPVVEPGTRRLVGVVSYVDVLRAALKFLRGSSPD